MPDSLNKHEPEKSPTLDPAVDDPQFAGMNEHRSDAHYDASGLVRWLQHAALVPRPHHIGVWNYESLVQCLKSNYEQAFPDETTRDPQDAIQRLAAEVLNLRLELAEAEMQKSAVLHQMHRIVARFKVALSDAASINATSISTQVAVETLRNVLGEE